MAKITVILSENRSVVIDGTERYTGTETGNNSLGNGNIETYDVTIMGVECCGKWNGNARRNTEVLCPAELRAELVELWRQREKAAKARELAKMSPADREYFGSF